MAPLSVTATCSLAVGYIYGRLRFFFVVFSCALPSSIPCRRSLGLWAARLTKRTSHIFPASLCFSLVCSYSSCLPALSMCVYFESVDEDGHARLLFFFVIGDSGENTKRPRSGPYFAFPLGKIGTRGVRPSTHLVVSGPVAPRSLTFSDGHEVRPRLGERVTISFGEPGRLLG